jgi:uncharacterized damage-inducible protein DinB
VNELKLIASLFDKEVTYTLEFLSAISDEDWDRVSQPWDSFLFHGLSVNVSVSKIVQHLAMLERYIIDAIATSENGAVLPTEGDDALCGQQGDHQELLACYRAVHAENLGKLLELQESDLEKELTFLGQQYTGTGLLWMLTGHHAFHLGQLRSMSMAS